MGEFEEVEIDPTSENPIPEPVLPEEDQARVESMLATGFEDK